MMNLPAIAAQKPDSHASTGVALHIAVGFFPRQGPPPWIGYRSCKAHTQRDTKKTMKRIFAGILLIAGLLATRQSLAATAPNAAVAGGFRHKNPPVAQDTGFLNRTVELRGTTYRYQVYLPEEFRRDDGKQWPVILFLHGRGERGSEGMWQTQVGLPAEVRDHPERWPFVIVIPQCPMSGFWTDPKLLQMAMDSLDKEVAEFHLDPDRTYLAGLSMGGYGAWELIRQHPKRWAAVTIAAGGIFWSYEPERWQQLATLPGEYARALGRTPTWLFHGSDDPVVQPKQSEILYDAVKNNGGRIRLWIYQGLKHDSWSRAFNEPELPKWLLSHHRNPHPELPPAAERQFVPLHPAAIKLPLPVLDGFTGEFFEPNGKLAATVYRQGEMLYEKTAQGDLFALQPETPTVFFYPFGSTIGRLVFERDKAGNLFAIYRNDRDEERWERKK